MRGDSWKRPVHLRWHFDWNRYQIVCHSYKIRRGNWFELLISLLYIETKKKQKHIKKITNVVTWNACRFMRSTSSATRNSWGSIRICSTTRKTYSRSPVWMAQWTWITSSSITTEATLRLTLLGSSLVDQTLITLRRMIDTDSPNEKSLFQRSSLFFTLLCVEFFKSWSHLHQIRRMSCVFSTLQVMCECEFYVMGRIKHYV